MFLAIIGIAALAGASYYLYKYSTSYNVLLITLDTTRADRLGCYGYESESVPGVLTSETLDSLAETGTRFDRAFCNVPLTLPAHASILTGLQPPEHGCRVNGIHRLGTEHPTMAEMFRRHGYRTAAFVAAFVLDARFGLDRGFDVYDDYEVPESGDSYDENRMYEYRRADAVADSTLEWLKTQGLKPFFCWVHFYDPHRPYYYKRDPYDKEIRFMDSQIGRIIKHLEKTGQLDKTLIVAVGDHGEGLGEHGEEEHGLLLHNAGVHVPLIFSLPGAIPGGKVVNRSVSHVDLLATLADLMGWDAPGRTSGRSLAGAFRGEPLPESPVFLETQFPFTEYGWSPLKGVVYGDWKYVDAPRPELYDIGADFGETNNLAEARPEILDELQVRLAGIENQMEVAEAAEIKLDAAAQEALESLGYLGGGREPADRPGEDLQDPKDVVHLRVQFIEALGLIKKQDYEQAEKLLRQIISESPESFAFQYKLATMLYRSGQYEKACDEYEEVARKYPEKYRAHYTFGTSLVKAGEYGKAIKELRLAMRIDDKQLPCYNNLGIALLKYGEVYEAIEVFRQSIAMKHDQKDPHNNLGTALFAVDRIEEAEKHYREAIKLDPGFVDPRYNLGLVLMRAGRPEEAIAQFKQTLRLDPNHPTARQKLKYAQQGKVPPPRPSGIRPGADVRIAR